MSTLSLWDLADQRLFSRYVCIYVGINVSPWCITHLVKNIDRLEEFSVSFICVLIGPHPKFLSWIGWAGVITLTPDNIDIGTVTHWRWWHQPHSEWQSKHFQFEIQHHDPLLLLGLTCCCWIGFPPASTFKYIHQLMVVSLGSHEIELSSGGRI